MDGSLHPPWPGNWRGSEGWISGAYRAADLAGRFRMAGLPVLIGGFHVSGTMAMFPEGTPEIRELTDLGVSVVLGEVEESWGGILSDALHDRLRPLYNFLDAKPDLTSQPVP